ncbi:MAG TPA: RNA polymerase sigma factor [Gemmatimonadaceae bacterium]|nr:RNA polymerase sigma factor [Gemmatimonadaceae bacterium]
MQRVVAGTGQSVDGDDLVRRAQQGDVGAFETLYRIHAPAAYAVCRRMLGNDDEARELLQDVFVRTWERLPSFRGESSLDTWLHRLAVNVVLERLRGSKRDAGRHADLSDDAIGRSPEADVDARMDLDTALATLPDGARKVFVLHDVYGYSHDEIASLTGIAPATARVQLWRARRALMRVLER